VDYYRGDPKAMYVIRRRKVVLNLEPTKYSPALVKETRRKLGMSQVLFAQFLGVSARAVQAWEQGYRDLKSLPAVSWMKYAKTRRIGASAS